MSDKKDESTSRAEEPATEAIPKQADRSPDAGRTTPIPVNTGKTPEGSAGNKPKPPKLPDAVKAEPTAAPPAKPAPNAGQTKTPKPPAKPASPGPVPKPEEPAGSEAETKAIAISAPKGSGAPKPPVAPRPPEVPNASEVPEPSEAETTAIPKVTPPPPRPVAKPHAGPRRIPPRADGTAPASDARAPQARPKPAAPQAKPQRIGPPPELNNSRRGGRRWILALVAAVILIAAVSIAGFVYLSGDREENSPEAQIRTAIGSYTQALSSGDLATLRSSSCGDLATYYRDIPDAEFADVHRVAVEQGNVPVVDGVDAVQITDDTAIAQVIAYTAANPNERSPRTFDLRLENEEWKIC